MTGDPFVSHRNLLYQLELFQAKGTGSFRDLTVAVAQDPAMLSFLDAGKNVKGAPNENFAREIMAASAEAGGPTASVTAIGTVDYPTPARRPANSRLSSAKLAAVHGVVLPGWQESTRKVVARLVRP
jgi:hypothetical protein